MDDIKYTKVGNEQTFTVIGTARGKQGILKVRWTNDLVGHYKRIMHQGCTDINFYNIPKPMSKLESLDWLIKNKDLNDEQSEIVFIKKAEKTRKKRLQTENELQKEHLDVS